MATYTKVKLSNIGTTNAPLSTFGAGLFTIHTTGTSSSILDEVWIWVTNGASDSGTITLAANGAYLYYVVPAYTTMMLSGGSILLSGDGTTASTVKFNEGAGGDLYIYGFVNRITA